MTSKSVKLSEAEVRWEETGEGMVVIFVHGIPTSPELWRHVIPLVANARCLAFEMVGYGKSIAAGMNRDISVQRQAEYLISWADAIGVRRAVLAGHDLGGGVVQIAAVRRPELAAGILLTNAIAYDSWPIPSVKLMRTMGGIVRRLPPAVVKAMVAPLFTRGHDDQNIARESLELHWRNYEATAAGDALIRQMKSLDVNDTMAVAEEVMKLRGVPTRIIWGAADPFQKIRYGERLAHSLDAPLQRIEGGKHFVPEDHPDIVARAINELVEAAR